MCRSRIRGPVAPIDLAARVKSDSLRARMLDLRIRAKIGTFSTAMARAIVFRPGPRKRTIVIVRSRPGRDRTMSTSAHHPEVDPAADEAADRPVDQAEGQADRDRQDGDPERRAGAPDDPRQDVPALDVGARGGAGRSAAGSGRSRWALPLVGLYGATAGRGDGHDHEQDDQARGRPWRPGCDAAAGRVQPEARALDRLVEDLGQGDAGHQEYLIRGLRKA